MVEMHFTTVSTLSDGKFVKHIAYTDHAAALEAAELTE